MTITRFYHHAGPHPKLVGPYLPHKDFLKVHANAPVIAVDLVIKRGKEFLLVKRTNPPEKGTWFIPGGRVAKNEILVSAAQRKLLEETGLAGSAPKLVMVAEHFNVKEYLPQGVSHFITFVFVVTVKSKKSVKLDSQSSDAKWFSKIPRGLHPYPKAALRAGGF